eukprot:Nk52_evm24s684 gene=Nk52_evmTU24s684
MKIVSLDKTPLSKGELEYKYRMLQQGVKQDKGNGGSDPVQSIEETSAKICVSQIDNRIAREDVLVSATQLYRWSIANGYRYKYSTCNSLHQRPSVIASICGVDGFSGVDTGKNKCDYHLYLDTDVFLRETSVTLEELITYHNEKSPGWMIAAGYDLIRIVKRKYYSSDIGNGELLLNCRHPLMAHFLREWWHGSYYENDMDVVGIMAKQHPYVAHVNIDAFYLGLYGVLTTHYAGGGKVNLLKDAKKVKANYTREGTKILNDSNIRTALNVDNTKILYPCPAEYSVDVGSKFKKLRPKHNSGIPKNNGHPLETDFWPDFL